MTHEEYVANRERSVCEQWAAGDLTWPHAIEALVKLGYDPHEARDLLNAHGTT